jgi:putative oxidoreductase
MNSALLDDTGKLLLRLGFGVLFLLHGVHKMMNGISGIEAMVVQAGLPEAVAYGVYVGEVLAPLLIILGWHARIGGLLTAVTMVFAIHLAHAHQLLDMTAHGGWQLELQGMFLLAGLVIALIGPGRISLNGR